MAKKKQHGQSTASGKRRGVASSSTTKAGKEKRIAPQGEGSSSGSEYSPDRVILVNSDPAMVEQALELTSKEPGKRSRSSRSTNSETSALTPSSSATEEVTIFGETYKLGQVPEGLPPEFKKLTAKQQLFVVYYAVTRNGVEAVKMAGYSGEYHTLGEIARQNLKKLEIIEAYDAYMRPLFDQQGVTVSRIVQNLADVAFSPWTEHIFVKEKQGRVVSVKMQMSSKVKALEILAKMTRLLGEDKGDIQAFIDNSKHVHIHQKYSTADEARQALLSYLRKRK